MPQDPSANDLDEFDYELEPADEEVTRLAEQRAQEDIAQAETKLDVDEIYRELHRRDEIDFDVDWKKFRPQFNLKSLFIATAVIAGLLTAWRLGMFNGSMFAALLALVLLVLSTAHAWTELYERRRQESVLARHERKVAKAHGEELPEEEDLPPEPKGLVEDLKDLLWRGPRFSIRHILLATAGVAALLWFVLRLGPAPSASLMGLFALAGVLIEAFGANPGPTFRLVWWLSVVGYCLITIGNALFSALGLA